MTDVGAQLDELLSAEQLEAVNAEGNVFLQARPGSGKTRTIAFRIARITSDTDKKLAAISYTNVAVASLSRMAIDAGARLDAQHFVGTLHEFLMHYVLRPFGHLKPIGLRRPYHLIVDEHWGGWSDIVIGGDPRKRLPVSHFHYSAEGTPKLYKDYKKRGVTRIAVDDAVIKDVKKAKKAARDMGLVSASDAMFYAQKLLEENPDIRDAIARRFDEILVDEAQDTSDVQLRCLELIHSTGNLGSLVLVGDLDQSIYGFQGAHPQKCAEASKACGLSIMSLTANYRSSQAICDVACRFCGRTDADHAAGPTAALGIVPEILRYSTSNPVTAVDAFKRRLKEFDIPERDAVVLARSGLLRDRLNGRRRPEKTSHLVECVGRLAAEYQDAGALTVQSCRAAERAIAQLAWDRLPSESDETERTALRRAASDLAVSLPNIRMDLNDWIEESREHIKRVASGIANPLAKSPSHTMKRDPRNAGYTAADLFAITEAKPAARTVHDVKGETHGAILLVVEKARAGKSQAELWARPLKGEAVDPQEEEELRIAYVALTRASAYVAIALPDGEDDSAYIAAGFVQVA